MAQFFKINRLRSRVIRNPEADPWDACVPTAAATASLTCSGLSFGVEPGNMRLTRRIGLYLMGTGAVFLLAACGGLNAGDAAFDKLASETKRQQDRPSSSNPAVRHVSRPYLGQALSKSAAAKQLPPRLAKLRSVTFNAAHGLSLEVLARRLSQLLQVPVAVDPGPDRTGVMATKPGQRTVVRDSTDRRFEQLQTIDPRSANEDNDRNSGLFDQQLRRASGRGHDRVYRPRFQGPPGNLLDTIADAFDADWRYHHHGGSRIVFRLTYAKTYQLNLPAKSFALAASTNAGAAGGKTGAMATSSNLKADAWQELDETLKLLAGAGHYQLAKLNGEVTVVGNAKLHQRVAGYVRRQNRLYGARIALEVTAAYVELSNTDDYNFTLNGLLNDVFDGVRGGLSGGATAITTGTLASAAILDSAGGRARHFAGSNAVLQALSARHKLADRRNLAAVTQHGVPVPFNLTRRQDIVRKVEVITQPGSDVVSTSIVSETIQVGLVIQALPRIVAGGNIQLSLAFKSSDLVSLQPYAAGENSTVQLAEIAERSFQQDLVLQPNETMLLIGFEQSTTERRDSGTGSPDFWLFGGGKTGARSKTRLVLLVNATILDAGLDAGKPQPSPERLKLAAGNKQAATLPAPRTVGTRTVGTRAKQKPGPTLAKTLAKGSVQAERAEQHP